LVVLVLGRTGSKQSTGFRHLSSPNLSQVSAKQEAGFVPCSPWCIQHQVEFPARASKMALTAEIH
jgi:hypothetical protein